MRTAIISGLTVEFYLFPFIYSPIDFQVQLQTNYNLVVKSFYMFLALCSLRLIEIYIFDNFALLYIALFYKITIFHFFNILSFFEYQMFFSPFLHQTFIYVVKGRVSCICF